ncbi:hypothetical protein MEA186_03749 [Mesorhizobium amorphae CCNWGS0123]|uniref:Uncharacterized protein n=1 Tax=Mesorhizobium amorphae CCNWGS0123 TaxID=1082933 RepID=G6Y491_9HYPH|nr:hypothetical protein MEA186_03749 [Mesorhizobium amorphae CCNWGS0123]
MASHVKLANARKEVYRAIDASAAEKVLATF